MTAEMLRGVFRGHKLALAQVGLGLIVIVAIGCGGGESKSVESAAPKVAAPTAAGVAGLDPMSRLEALIRAEFAGLTNEGLTRFHSADVRREPDGSYRVVAEFVSDDVPQGTDEREVIPARKRLMEERMQHAFLTLYTSGIDVNNAIISAQFKTSIKIAGAYTGGERKDLYTVLYRTWMTREKAAGVNWGGPSLDLRTVWEVPLLHPSYR